VLRLLCAIKRASWRTRSSSQSTHRSTVSRYSPSLAVARDSSRCHVTVVTGPSNPAEVAQRAGSPRFRPDPDRRPRGVARERKFLTPRASLSRLITGFCLRDPERRKCSVSRADKSRRSPPPPDNIDTRVPSFSNSVSLLVRKCKIYVYRASLR